MIPFFFSLSFRDKLQTDGVDGVAKEAPGKVMMTVYEEQKQHCIKANSTAGYYSKRFCYQEALFILMNRLTDSIIIF